MKLTPSFGRPTFVNHGRNYEGVRDEFVYVYSHDSDSACRRVGQMVLARVLKHRLQEQAAWEFFQELDALGRPVWTKHVARRGAVLTGRFAVSDVPANAADYSHRPSPRWFHQRVDVAARNSLWCDSWSTPMSLESVVTSIFPGATRRPTGLEVRNRFGPAGSRDAA